MTVNFYYLDGTALCLEPGGIGLEVCWSPGTSLCSSQQGVLERCQPGMRAHAGCNRQATSVLTAAPAGEQRSHSRAQGLGRSHLQADTRSGRAAPARPHAAAHALHASCSRLASHHGVLRLVAAQLSCARQCQGRQPAQLARQHHCRRCAQLPSPAGLVMSTPFSSCCAHAHSHAHAGNGQSACLAPDYLAAEQRSLPSRQPPGLPAQQPPRQHGTHLINVPCLQSVCYH